MEFAQSAPTALERIAEAADQALILILSDINMPGMSGLELLPKAKAMWPDVPIVMITAYGDAGTKRKALESGAEALLTKPIDFGTLRTESAAALSEPRRGRTSLRDDQLTLAALHNNRLMCLEPATRSHRARYFRAIIKIFSQMPVIAGNQCAVLGDVAAQRADGDRSRLAFQA
jgi:CheY-like chemotaxis protein